MKSVQILGWTLAVIVAALAFAYAIDPASPFYEQASIQDWAGLGPGRWWNCTLFALGLGALLFGLEEMARNASAAPKYARRSSIGAIVLIVSAALAGTAYLVASRRVANLDAYMDEHCMPLDSTLERKDKIDTGRL